MPVHWHKRMEEEHGGPADQDEGVGFLIWARCRLEGCVYNVTTMEFIKMSIQSFSSKLKDKDQQQ